MKDQIMQTFNQDCGYAWVVCAASFITHLIYNGIFFAMGMFYIIFKENIPSNNMALSLVSSLNAAVYLASCPLVSMLVTKFGERRLSVVGALLSCLGLLLATQATQVYHIYITFGLLTGFGLALQCIPALTLLHVYFDKWLGVASGIASSGTGVGSIIIPFLVNYLTELYNWQGSLLLIGAIQLQCVVTSALYRPYPAPTTGKKTEIPHPNNNTKDGITVHTPTNQHQHKIHSANLQESTSSKVVLSNLDEDCTSHDSCRSKIKTLQISVRWYFSIFQDLVFTGFCISVVFYSMAMMIVYTHLGNYAKHLGFSNNDAVQLYSVIGATNAVSRLLSGLLTQIPGCHPLHICLVMLPLGLATSLFSFYNSLPQLLLYSVLFGMFIAPHIALAVKASKDLLPPDKVFAGIGIIYLSYAPGSLLGAPLAGWLYDTTGIYIYSFYLACGFMYASGFVIIFCLWMKKKQDLYDVSLAEERQSMESVSSMYTHNQGLTKRTISAIKLRSTGVISGHLTHRQAPPKTFTISHPTDTPGEILVEDECVTGVSNPCFSMTHVDDVTGEKYEPQDKPNVPE